MTARQMTVDQVAIHQKFNKVYKMILPLRLQMSGGCVQEIEGLNSS